MLTVLVLALGVEDGEIAPPVMGEGARFDLSFDERPDGEPDATVCMVRARAEPRSAAAPRQGLHWDGTPNPLPPTWPTLLHGDGWSAVWSAPRPVLGEVELRGVLAADLGVFGSDSPTRGRVIRAQLVTETYRRTGTGPGEWRREPAAQRLDEVAATPRWFDRGLVPDPDAPTPGWAAMVALDPRVVQTGVLVLLDLDDAPPLPLRPSIVPGALAAHGLDRWVLDSQLPLLVRLRHEQVAAVITWPGGIVSGRSVHADADGCWVSGPDGVLRVPLQGTVHQVAEEQIWLAAGSGATLAAQVILAPDDVHSPSVLRLREPGHELRDIDLGDRYVRAIAAQPGGFLLLVTTPEDHRSASLARVRRDATGMWAVKIGPVVTDDAYACHLAGGEHPVLAHFRGVRPVRADLTLGDAVPVPGLIGVHAREGRVWVVHHPIDGTRPLDPWPSDWPAQHDHQHWVLSELDARTLTPMGSTPVPGVVDQVWVGDEGAVWTVAAGLRRCRGDGSPAELVDVAALLDAQPHPAWGWADG